MENIFFQAESLVTGTYLQTPSGGLIDEAERALASPSDDLEEPEVVETFQTVGLSIQEVPIRQLIFYDGLPDYRKPTLAEHPFVVRTPLGDHCIGGRDLAETALEDGQETISCVVEVLARHSDAEISIRKAELRMATRGGIALYPEKIRNTRGCEEQLRASHSDLRSFGRGGRRFGEGFVNDSEKDIVHILSLRFMRDRDTITTYLLHGKHLSDEALQTLIDGEAPKKFFEKHQTKKQKLIDELVEQRATEFEKTEWVSAKMLEYFEEWREAQRQGRGSSRRVVQQDNPTPPVPEPVPEDEGVDREENALSESEGSDEEAPPQHADCDEGESDEDFAEPEEDGDEFLSQSSGNDVGDGGIITDEEDEGAEPAPTVLPGKLTMNDAKTVLLALLEQLVEVVQKDQSPIELAKSLRQGVEVFSKIASELEWIGNQ